MSPIPKHPLKIAERAAHDAFAKAMRDRDAIEVCATPEWRAAHQVAKEKAQEWHVASENLFKAAKECKSAAEAFNIGLEFAPYWWGPVGS